MDVETLAKKLVVSGRLISSLKVAELKDELKNRNMKNSGNKPQLQELLVAAVLQEQQAHSAAQDQLQSAQDNSILNNVPSENILNNPSVASGDSYSVIQNDNQGVKLIIRSSPTKNTPTIFEASQNEATESSVQDSKEEASLPIPVADSISDNQTTEVVSESQIVAETALEKVSTPQVLPKPITDYPKASEEITSQTISQSASNPEMTSIAEQKSDETTAELNDNSSDDNEKNTSPVNSSSSHNEPTKDAHRSDSPKLTIRPRKLTLQRSQNQDSVTSIATTGSGTLDATSIEKTDKRPKWGSKRDSNAQKGITSNELKQIIDDSKLLDDITGQKVGKNETNPVNKADLSMEDSNPETSASGSSQIIARKSQDSLNDSATGPLSQNSSIAGGDGENEPNQSEPAKSPAKNLPTCILHVLGLARPYTMPSLKRLLTKFGEIDNEKFWTDKKRSECFAVYSSIEVAEQTREYLHGLRWPVSSPNTLSVDFESEAILERCLKEPDESISVSKKSDDTKNNGLNDKYDIIKNDSETRNSSSASKGSKLIKIIREWDKNKDESCSGTGNKRKRDISRSKSPSPKRKERRQASPERGEKRRDDGSLSIGSPKRERLGPISGSVATTKMDDLFKKTIAQPHIYYKPLNDDEARQRDIDYRNKPRPVFVPNRKGGRFGDRRRGRSPPPFRRDRSFSPQTRRGGYGGFRPPPSGGGGRFRSPPQRSRHSPAPYRRAGSPPLRRGSPPPRRGPPSSPPSRRGASPPPRRGSPGFLRRGSPPRGRVSPRRDSPPYRRGSPPPRRRSPMKYRR